jgi:hypothetical protein
MMSERIVGHVRGQMQRIVEGHTLGHCMRSVRRAMQHCPSLRDAEQLGQSICHRRGALLDPSAPVHPMSRQQVDELEECLCNGDPRVASMCVELTCPFRHGDFDGVCSIEAQPALLQSFHLCVRAYPMHIPFTWFRHTSIMNCTHRMNTTHIYIYRCGDRDHTASQTTLQSPDKSS